MLRWKWNERLWIEGKWSGWVVALSRVRECALKKRCAVATQKHRLKKLSPIATAMARLVALQQNQLSLSPLASSLSDFSGTRLQSQLQVLQLPPYSFPLSLYICMYHWLTIIWLQLRRKVWQPKGGFYVSASSAKKILVMGGTRFIGVFLSRLLVKEGHQVWIEWVWFI